MQPDVQGSGPQPQIRGNLGPLGLVDVDAPDQIGVGRAQFAQQPLDALAEDIHPLDAILDHHGRFGLQRHRAVEAPCPARLPEVIIEGRAQHRIEPGVHPLGLAQLIPTRKNPDAEFLQDILGIRAIAQSLHQEAQKRLSAGDQRPLQPRVVTAGMVANEVSGLVHDRSPFSRGWKTGYANRTGHSRAHLFRAMM